MVRGGKQPHPFSISTLWLGALTQPCGAQGLQLRMTALLKHANSLFFPLQIPLLPDGYFRPVGFEDIALTPELKEAPHF